MNLPGSYCASPEPLSEQFVPDPENKFSVDALMEMWRRFRINNPTSLRLYPNVAHLQEDTPLTKEQENVKTQIEALGIPFHSKPDVPDVPESVLANFREEYKETFEPTFLAFIGNDVNDVPSVRQMLFVPSDRSGNVFVVAKNGKEFVIYGVPLPQALRDALDEQATMISNEIGYFGPWLDIMLFECKQQSIINQMAKYLTDVFRSNKQSF